MTKEFVYHFAPPPDFIGINTALQTYRYLADFCDVNGLTVERRPGYWPPDLRVMGIRVIPEATIVNLKKLTDAEFENFWQRYHALTGLDKFHMTKARFDQVKEQLKSYNPPKTSE